MTKSFICLIFSARCSFNEDSSTFHTGTLKKIFVDWYTLKIRWLLKNQFICVINPGINSFFDKIASRVFLSLQTDKPFLCTWSWCTLKLIVDYVPRRNPLLRVYLLQVCKTGLSLKKPVQGFISLQQEKYPWGFFIEKRVYTGLITQINWFFNDQRIFGVYQSTKIFFSVA